jgi:hypothetical protein
MASVMMPANATSAIGDGLQVRAELQIVDARALIGGEAVGVARQPYRLGRGVPDGPQLVGKLEQQRVGLELVGAHLGDLRNAQGRTQRANDDDDERESDRHEPQQSSDHEQQDDKQQRERQVEQRRSKIPCEQLATDLELTEARQLRSDRGTLRHGKRQIEHRRKRSDRNDGIETGGKIGNHLGSRPAQR